jgi:uncharacterized membrane protein required for colicin V production
MIIDIIFVLIIILSGIIGYFKGFFKELYSIINIFVSLLLMYLINNVIGFHILGNLIKDNVKTTDCQIADLIKEYLTSILSGVVLFLLIYIIIVIITRILMKKNKIPNNTKTLRPVGVILSLLKGIVFIGFISLFLSLTTLIEDFNVYDDSSLAPVFLKLNYPLNKTSENTKQLYHDLLDVAEAIGSSNNMSNLTPSQLDTFKEVLKNDLITDDFLIEILKIIIGNLDFDRNQVFTSEEVRNAITNNERYSILKELYDDKVITDKLIKNIIKENNLQVNPNDIIDVLKK